MIIFENKGELDIRAIKTFGVNSKNNPDSAIGYFGTGLKYAIAILLRNGCEISIITGGINYKFGVKRSKIRNDEFDIVTMNDEELGFTTELGKGWEPWMAYRELHSNMLDEGGTVYKANMARADIDKTFVLVTGGDFENLFEERHRFFLDPERRKPVQTHKEVDAYLRSSDECGVADIFYKGVRVMQSRGHSLYDYNHHKGLTLTEDRTIRDSWLTLYHVAALVSQSQDKSFIKQMVMAPATMYESGINYRQNMKSGMMETFLDVVGELREKYKDKGINRSAIEAHKEERSVPTVMPGISCYLTEVQVKQLEKATQFCRDTLGLDIDDYKLIVCKDIGGNLGEADIEKGIMYISKKCFDEGTKRVAVAILEEYTHCKHEVLDETVAQKWIYLQQIISLGETIDGEPL